MTQELKKLIDTAIERNATTRQSNSLSPSMLNNPCARHVFYQFRWASNPPKHSAKMLRIFNRGHRDEAQMIEWLKQAGIHVTHERDGKQLGYEDFNGHVKGFVDGIVEIDGKKSILECKTVNEGTYKVISNTGLQGGKKDHYLQIQLYMYFMKIHSALYMAINKNTDDIYLEHVIYDESSIVNHIRLIAELIYTQTIPEQAHTTPKGYLCHRFGGCPHMAVCFSGVESLQTCRSCMHSEPYTLGGVEKNSWHCKKHDAILTLDDQGQRARDCAEYTKLF